MSKCVFAKPSVQFLGHVVSGNGVHVDPSKIETSVNWPQPRDVSELRSFLGLGDYFKRFIQGYAVLTDPLVELTKPSKLVLALPDLTKSYEVICDACGFASGAVLVQDGRPLAFHSYQFHKHDRNYAIGEHELLAVVLALKQY